MERILKVALVIASAILILQGCITLRPAIDKAAQANDSALQAAEFTICRGASVGSIRRRYGDNPDVWKELCKETDGWSP